MTKSANRLFNKLTTKNYTPQNICEVGVYLPEASNLIDFINNNTSTTLVEADPVYITKLKSYFANKKNVTIIESAVFDYNGTIELCRSSASTFISILDRSPALINDNYKINDTEKFVTKSILFSEIDKGDFDLISIDIEGAEWYVIKHMVSRPNIISIETHGKFYTNPNLKNILDWMNKNNYQIWYKTGSDTIFIKKGVFPIKLIEKIQLYIRNIEIQLIKVKKPIRYLLNLIKS